MKKKTMVLVTILVVVGFVVVVSSPVSPLSVEWSERTTISDAELEGGYKEGDYWVNGEYVIDFDATESETLYFIRDYQEEKDDYVLELDKEIGLTVEPDTPYYEQTTDTETVTIREIGKENQFASDEDIDKDVYEVTTETTRYTPFDVSVYKDGSSIWETSFGGSYLDEITQETKIDGHPMSVTLQSQSDRGLTAPDLGGLAVVVPDPIDGGHTIVDEEEFYNRLSVWNDKEKFPTPVYEDIDSYKEWYKYVLLNEDFESEYGYEVNYYDGAVYYDRLFDEVDETIYDDVREFEEGQISTYDKEEFDSVTSEYRFDEGSGVLEADLDQSGLFAEVTANIDSEIANTLALEKTFGEPEIIRQDPTEEFDINEDKSKTILVEVKNNADYSGMFSPYIEDKGEVDVTSVTGSKSLDSGETAIFEWEVTTTDVSQRYNDEVVVGVEATDSGETETATFDYEAVPVSEKDEGELVVSARTVDGELLEDAPLVINDDKQTGNWTGTLQTGTYTVEGEEHMGYEPQSNMEVEVEADKKTEKEFVYEYVGQEATLSGNVYDEGGEPIQGVKVSVDGEVTETDSSGYWSVEVSEEGVYSATFSKWMGLQSETVSVGTDEPYSLTMSRYPLVLIGVLAAALVAIASLAYIYLNKQKNKPTYRRNS